MFVPFCILTIDVESMPPERKCAIGTSDIFRKLTAFLNNSKIISSNFFSTMAIKIPIINCFLIMFSENLKFLFLRALFYICL